MATEEQPVQPPPEEPSAEEKLRAQAEVAERFEAEAAPVLEQEVYLAPEVQTVLKGSLGIRVADYARSNPLKVGSITALVIALIVGFFWPDVPKPHVALGGEPFSTNPNLWWLTNSVLTTIIIDILLIVGALAVRFRLKLVPNGFQNFMELLLEYFYGLSEQVAGKAARNYFPWVMTIFLLVILSNWSGMIPGVGSIGMEHHAAAGAEEEQSGGGLNAGAQLAMADGNLILLSNEAAPAAAPQQEEPATGVAPTAEEEAEAAVFVPFFRAPSADLNLTFALAISTMIMVQIWGVRALGGSYFRKFFNASGKGAMKGISVFVGLLELISEVARIISFGFRLFGNIFAGEIVLATMAFLAAFILPVPFYLLEMFVGFVQALVFAMLALVFFAMATVGHGDHHDEHDEKHDKAHGEAHGEAAAAAAH